MKDRKKQYRDKSRENGKRKFKANMEEWVIIGSAGIRQISILD